MKTRFGQSLLEILLAIGLSAIVMPALFLGFMTARSGKAQQNQRLVAMPLLVEGQEAVRSLKERDWEQFVSYQTGVIYHPEISSGHWLLSNDAETINGFTRQVELQNVFRNPEGAIVEQGGILDLSTKKVTVTVLWSQPESSSVQSVSYLTRHHNLVYTETTEAQFNQGELTSVVVTNQDDGEVILGSTGGYGDWCNPTLSMSAFDLPKSGVANAISAIEGQIAAGTGENASGVSYANILIDDPPLPTDPTPVISGTFDGYKTNDVFVEADYAYLATDNNVKEIVIIDLNQTDTNGKFIEAGYFDIPGNVDGLTINVQNNIGYVTYNNRLYNFNLAVKTGSRPILDPDGVVLPGTAMKTIIVGSRAYVATASTSNQLAIVDLTNSNNLTVVEQISVAGAGGKGLFVNRTATRAYLATANAASQREFFIIDIESSSPQFKQTLSSYDTNGMNPKGVVTVTGPRAIIVGLGGEEYQVVDITQEAPSDGSLLPQCGGMQIDSGVNGIATVFTTANRAYSYIITGDATSELKIVEGGPGESGSAHTLSGEFLSQIFDVLSLTGNPPVAFNRLYAEFYQPSLMTDIRLQIALADPVDNSCNNAVYELVGPDKTASTYFVSTDGMTISQPLPFDDDGVGYENPSRCLRYKVWLSTQDETLTPILNLVTINFSP